MEDDEPDYDPWDPLRKKVREISKNRKRKKSNGFQMEVKSKTMPRKPLPVPYQTRRTAP